MRRPMKCSQRYGGHMRPGAKFIKVESHVTVSGFRPNVVVVAEGPWRYTLHGNVPAGDATFVRISSVPDPATFARLLFMECLRRAGVAIATNPLNPMPAPDRKPTVNDRQLAEHVSLPVKELTKVTLMTSHNLYASMLPCLIAAQHGQRTAREGLAIQGRFMRELGLDTDATAFAGGAGGMPADSTSPRATVDFLHKLRGRPEYPAFEYGLPFSAWAARWPEL